MDSKLTINISNGLKKNLLENIKSNYILNKLFNNLKRAKLLNLIKYNNYIKNRLNININDYYECSLIIEIEIKPKKRKYGKFINFHGENQKYYHIYFDDNKKEIKRNYLIKDDKVIKIKIIIENKIKSFESLFYLCECIEAINFKKFNCTNITNMSFMFNKCT